MDNFVGSKIDGLKLDEISEVKTEVLAGNIHLFLNLWKFGVRGRKVERENKAE
jgi:hypothetical protein